MKSLASIGLVWIIGMLWIVLMLALDAYADQWTFFYPETVTAFGCRSELVSQRISGTGVYADAWEARAHASRNDKSLGDWSMSLAAYPPTLKGRHQAEKVCSKWMDEASKRVKKAK